MCFDVLHFIVGVGFNVAEFPNHINCTINNHANLTDKLLEEGGFKHSLHVQRIISVEYVYCLQLGGI